MKIYFKENKIINSIPRKFYADWIKPLFPYSRHDIYGIRKKDLSLSLNPKNTDLLILPLTWNYYFEFRKVDEAKEILNFFIHLKIFKVFILLRSISAHKPFGITLEILSFNPPPVIFAHPLIKLYFIKFKISLT